MLKMNTKMVTQMNIQRVIVRATNVIVPLFSFSNGSNEIFMRFVVHCVQTLRMDMVY